MNNSIGKTEKNTEKSKKFISICIPSYNRPHELERLIKSLDYSNFNELEIVICEDKSPKRDEIRDVVKKIKLESPYDINYVENISNYGYDRNLRETIKNASGEYIIFMGDDDVFVSGALDKYSDFLKENNDLGYVLKTSRAIKANGDIEEFRYYSESKFFEKGYDSYITLFRKSVFISGFTFKRELSIEHLIDTFDNTLLFQLYILAEISLKSKTAYCDILLTEQYEGGTPMFGSSEVEKSLYTPGTITIENSVNFIKSFYKITRFLDEKYGFDSTSKVKKDMSKYSYPILSIQRKKGVREFSKYHKELKKIGINNTVYYYIYYYSLVIVGEKICDKTILKLKKILGATPRL